MVPPPEPSGFTQLALGWKSRAQGLRTLRHLFLWPAGLPKVASMHRRLRGAHGHPRDRARVPQPLCPDAAPLQLPPLRGLGLPQLLPPAAKPPWTWDPTPWVLRAGMWASLLQGTVGILEENPPKRVIPSTPQSRGRWRWDTCAESWRRGGMSPPGTRGARSREPQRSRMGRSRGVKSGGEEGGRGEGGGLRGSSSGGSQRSPPEGIHREEVQVDGAR